MFEALLYWDRLTCIVPFEDFRPGAHWGELDREGNLLHDRFVTGLAPSDEVKARVHGRLEDLLGIAAPAWCGPESLAPSERAVMATRKLSDETVQMLEEHGWMRAESDELALISDAAAGLVLSVIAEEMASDTMPAVTDDPTAFKATCNGLLCELQSQQGIGVTDGGECYPLDPIDPHEDSELGIALARISKIGIGTEGIVPGMFERLHDLRLDSGFDEQREHFREQIDRYVADLRQRPPIEHQAIHDHWALRLASDREGLKKELRAAGIEGLTEKEGWIATGLAAVAGAGSFAAFAAAGPAVLVIGLGLAGFRITGRVNERRKRAKERHWTSWLAAASETPARTFRQ